MIFESPRLYIRQYTIADFGAFFRMHSNKELMRYIRNVQTAEECEAFLRENINGYKTAPKMGRWAMLTKADQQIIGSFSILPLSGTEEVHLGYLLFQEYQGKGFASEATKAGINYCFEQMGLKTIVAVTEVSNTTSQRVLLRNGFIHEKTYKEGETKLNLYRLNR